VRICLQFIVLLFALKGTPAFANPDTYSCEYLFGGVRPITGISKNNSGAFSQDEKTIVFSDTGNIVLHDLETGKETKFPFNGQSIYTPQKIGDEIFYLLYEKNEGQVMALNPANGKKRKLGPALNSSSFPYQSGENLLSPGTSYPVHNPYDQASGQFVLSSKSMVRLIKAADGTHRDIELPASIATVNIMPGAKKADVLLVDHAPGVLDLETGVFKELSGVLYQTTSLIGGNGKYALYRHSNPSGTAVNQAGFMRHNLTTGENSFFHPPDLDAQSVWNTPNGIIYRNTAGDFWRWDIETNQATEILKRPEDLYFKQTTTVSRSGQKIAWKSSKNTTATSHPVNIFDHKTGKTWEIDVKNLLSVEQVSFSHSENLVALLQQDHKTQKKFLTILDLSTGKTRGAMLDAAYSYTTKLSFTLDDQQLIVGGYHEPILIDNHSLESFSARARIVEVKGDTSLATLAASGKIRLAKNFPEIDAFFTSGKYIEQPELAQRLLLSVLHESPLTFDSMVEKYPNMIGLSSNKLDLSNMPTGDHNAWIKSAKAYVERQLHKILIGSAEKSKFNDWERLKIITPLLRQLPDEVRRDISNRIAGAIANAAIEDELRGVFHQKIFKFAKQTVRPLFGMKSEALVDLEPVLIHDDGKDRLVPTLFSTSQIDGDPLSKNKYGFYSKKLALVPLQDPDAPAGTAVMNKSWTWKNEEGEFTSSIDIKTGKGGAHKFIPQGNAPDYAGLWRDNNLSGLMVMGDNMGEDSALLAEYESYYRRQGFKFKVAHTPMADLSGWMKEKISSGKLDYLIKEAHSDGMDRDLFRFNNAGSLQVGTKALPGGKSETVAIFHPDYGSEKRLLPNSEFGNWMKERDAKPEAGPLLYLNTSCYSMTKACREMEAAATEKLVVFGAPDTVDTFEDAQDSALRQLLTGIRQKKTYPEIRKMMEKDPDFKNGSANTMLMPDQEGYRDFMRENSKIPLEIKIETKDSSGKILHLDGGE
jgi:hypothetical protein